MGSIRFFTLKKAKLSNNCPECYSNDGLELTFKQKLSENMFYKTITSDVKSLMHCHNCNTQIFPVRWTDDIERVVDYKKRAIQPKAKSLKLKPVAWAFITFCMLLIIGIILLAMGIISFK